MGVQLNALVLDEVNSSRIIYTKYFEKLGFSTVFTAATVEDAKRIFDANAANINVVTTNHRLPDGPGENFIAHIRKSTSNSNVPILCIAGTDKIPDSTADITLLKPLSKNELNAVLQVLNISTSSLENYASQELRKRPASAPVS